MATYPTLKQSPESTRTRLAGIVTDEGGDLSLWVRIMAPVEKFKFTIFHVVNSTQLATLMAFYSANKSVVFDFVFRDDLTVTHTNVVFLDAPQKVAHHARGLFTYRVEARVK